MKNAITNESLIIEDSETANIFVEKDKNTIDTDLIVEISNVNVHEVQSSEVIRYDYPVHPYLSTVPAMSQRALKGLVSDVFFNGLINAITVRWKESDYELLDGRARLKACEILGIKPKIQFINLIDDEVIDFIRSQNDIRRHDPISRIACKAFLTLLQAKLEKYQLKISKAKGKYSDENFVPVILNHLDASNLRKSVAELYGISENRIATAKEIYDYNQEYFFRILRHELRESNDNKETYWELENTKIRIDVELEEEEKRKAKEIRLKNKSLNKQDLTEDMNEIEHPKLFEIKIAEKKIVFDYSQIQHQTVQAKFLGLSNEQKEEIANKMALSMTELFEKLVIDMEDVNE